MLHAAAGSSIGEEALEEFARVTGASVSLTDLSVPSLSADYVPDDLDYFQCTNNILCTIILYIGLSRDRMK